MAKGHSRRIVFEVDPDLKRELYGALAVDDSTLKEWFLDKVSKYLEGEAGDVSKKAEKNELHDKRIRSEASRWILHPC
jgi:hypothetical protein